MGFREPLLSSFDLPTGDLWIGAMGQGLFEEVTIARKGEDHGWNAFEGFRLFSDRYSKPAAPSVPPGFAPARGVKGAGRDVRHPLGA